FFDSVHSGTRNTDEDKLISIFDSKKSFALTFKHLFSAINIILKQLQYMIQIVFVLMSVEKATLSGNLVS
ncbi:MAG TPA: hypothetical protein DEP28_12290, partial [Bacteroidetes bacterium]|nr:hypothetical protein [Bacteroidota bacterium]